MKRREFFSRFVPQKDRNEESLETVRKEEEKTKPPMTENERFLRAMELGIDPATVTPGQLEELVSNSETPT